MDGSLITAPASGNGGRAMPEGQITAAGPAGGSRRRPRPRAVLFDVYGALFDVHCVADLAGEMHLGHGQALARAWRLEQVDYTRSAP